MITASQWSTSAAIAAHDVEQAWPIKLGTTGGNINYSSSNYCCSGTLGSLVEDGGAQYILSNNHILARVNAGPPGEEIIQPGLIDQEPVCYEDVCDVVAYLADFVEIRFADQNGIPLNQVDAAIAQVIPGAVEANGAILDIGTVSRQTTEATIGQAVKKSGRTTELTFGTIAAIGLTVDVVYPDGCGGTNYRIARFTNQILIDTPGFGGPGDSGSLIVEDVNTEPRAVGLLFAGTPDGRLSVANPIDAVLEAFGVTMAGEPGPEPSGSIAGTVTNKTDRSPIEGAVVRVDSRQFAVTGEDGSYLISNVPVGKHFVLAFAEGFRPRIKRVKVRQNRQTAVDFALKACKRCARWRFLRRAIRRALEVKKRHEHDIFRIKGVVGSGVSLTKTAEPVIEIYLQKDGAQALTEIPAALEDVLVRTVVTGLFEAL